MFSLFSHKGGKGLSLVIDIQSGLVRGALVSLGLKKEPHIVYIVSKFFSHKNDAGGSYITKNMIETVKEVAMSITSEGLSRAKSMGFSHHPISDVHYVLSSPWVISQSKTVQIDYEKDTEITDSLVTQIVDSERENLLKKFKEGNFSEEYEFDLEFIEQKIFDVRLNGYPVEDYKGKKVRNFEISFAVTTSSKHILEKIEDAIAQSIHVKNRSFHSALLLQYTALRSLVGNREEYISIHVHGELTDIIVIKRGISSYLASFPFGTTSLLRKISSKLKNSDETSASMISMHENGTLEKIEDDRFVQNLNPILKEWQSECLKSLNIIGERTILPRIVYLSTHAYFDTFKNILKETQFEVFHFDETLVDNAVTLERSSERNTLMEMYAFALNTMIQ